jgi:cysteine-S-conjugate beta-lyase
LFLAGIYGDNAVMPLFDFDAPIDRRQPPHNDAVKWAKYADPHVLPMWVADMDFAAPPVVLEALHRRVDHGVLGYPDVTHAVRDAVLLHLSRDLGWQVDPDWLVWLPGLVTGLNVACRAVGEPGDAVLTAVPIYPPFMSSPYQSHRRLQTFALSQSAECHSWMWDMDAMLAASDASTRLLMLCNPHNPVGRVWRRDELLDIAAVAEQQDWIICSDDIHCELVLDKGVQYTPLASLAPEIARRTITLFAPSKTYNIPGMGASFAVVPDLALRRRFERAMAGIVPHINVLGYTAMAAAYRSGVPWRNAVRDYLRVNRDILVAAVNSIPGLHMNAPEATYLAWIDARELTRPEGMSAARYFEQAGVGLSPGEDFMPGATDFVRLNFGCTRANLDKAIERISTFCR